MTGKRRGNLPVPLKIARAQMGELWRIVTIQPKPPARLLARVGRWTVAVAIREFAWQLSILGLVALVVLALASGLDSGPAKLGFAVIAALSANELRLALASKRSAAEVERALAGLELEEGPRMSRAMIAFPLLMLFPRNIAHDRAVAYHRDSTGTLRLDVYRPAGRRLTEGPRPAVIQVHGGGWIVGSRLEQGIPLLNHLASCGWVGFNIDYRLSPQASWPDHIVDVKRAIAWVRENHERFGIDPERVCLTGGSAGGHLTALAGLTENDPAFQPGFEDSDTSLSVVVPFYGVYDLTDADRIYWPAFNDWILEKLLFKVRREADPERFRAASPRFRVHSGAPPFLVIHGDRDTLVPVADARTFAGSLEAVSHNPVRYIELPGAEHAFDLLPSLRTARTVEGIERFLRATLAARTGVQAPSPAEIDRPRQLVGI